MQESTAWTAERTLVLTRTLNAPRAVVWKAWTDPVELAKWWGPRGFTNPVCEFDARPGGKVNIHMTWKDGTTAAMGGVVKEVVPQERLVFSATVPGEDGTPKLENLNTITFEEVGSKTLLTVTATIVHFTPEAAQNIKGMEMGWIQTLDKLAELVAKN